jgi:hypothetical protein
MMQMHHFFDAAGRPDDGGFAAATSQIQSVRKL